MKNLVLVITTMLAGSFAQAVTCADHWGNAASVKFSKGGVSISSAKYGSTGFLRANGASSSSYYFRNGTGTTAIVNKSVMNGGAGKVVVMIERHDEPDTRATFYCN